jgi:hypothetical protein
VFRPNILKGGSSPMSVVFSEPVADLVAVAGKLRADDRLVTSPEMQLAEAEAIVDVVTTLQAVLVRRIRDARMANAPEAVCGRTAKGWLREELFLSGSETSRYLRCVFRLGSYPVVAGAFDAAEISFAHVLVLMTALDQLPAGLRDTLEPVLVAHARLCVPEDIAGFVDELLDALGVDKAADVRRERRLAERGVDLHPGLDGTRSLQGSLTPEVGQALADALAKAGQPCGPDDDRTPRQRAHDALGVIATHYLGSDGVPSFTGTPRTVIVTIDLETLENQLRERSLRLPDDATISAATARRLACDAELIPVVLGSHGEVLDVGQATREFTVAQRRAAYLRDRGRCAFPDCRGHVVELHHLRFRRHGGPGTLDNAAWLCAFHHWLVHDGHWTLQRDPHDQSYLWTGPAGQQRRRHLTTA